MIMMGIDLCKGRVCGFLLCYITALSRDLMHNVELICNYLMFEINVFFPLGVLVFLTSPDRTALILGCIISGFKGSYLLGLLEEESYHITYHKKSKIFSKRRLKQER